MKLTEQFYTAEDARGITAEVYINPTTTEIEEHIPGGARGFIDLKGNLYLEGYDQPKPYSSLSHEGLLSMVYHTDSNLFPYSYIKEYNFPLPEVFAATVQRFGQTNQIYVGESEHNSDAILEEFFRRASRKNPQWEYVIKSITTVDSSWTYTAKASKGQGGLIGLKDFEENYLIFDPVIARNQYKENSALRDQLKVMGVFNYINEDAAKVTKLTFEDTTDAGKTAKLNTIHSQYPFYIRPTEDYTLNNRVVKVNPEDEVYFQNGHIIVKRDGEVFQDLPAEKIEGIYWVDKSGLNERKINTYKTLMALCERHEYGDYKNILEIAEPMKAALIDYNEGLYNRLVKRVVLPKKLINEEIHYTDVGVITAFLKDNIPPMTDTGGIGKEVKGHLVYAITIATGTILRLFGYALALAYKSKGKDFIFTLTKQKTSVLLDEKIIELIDLIGTKASEFGIESYAVFNVDSVAIGELDALKDQLSPGPASEGRKWVKDLKPGDVIEDEIGDELTVQSIDYNENGYFQGSKHYKVTFEENPTEPRYYEDDAQVSIASSSKDATSPFEGDEMFKESTDPEIDQYLDIYLKEIGEKIDGMFSEAEEGEQMSLAASTPGKGNLQEKDPERAKHLFKPEIELAPDRKKLVGNIIGTLRKFDRTHHFYDCSSQVPKSLRPYFLELIYQVIQSLSVGEVLKVIEVTRGRESLFTIIYDRVQEKNHKVVTNEDSVTFQSAEQLALFNTNEGGTVTVGQGGMSLVDFYKTTERKPVKGFENPAKYKSMLHNRLKTNVGEALGLSYFIRDFKIPGSIYKKAIMTMPHDKSSFPDFMVDFSKLDTQSQQTFVEILGFHPPRYIFFDTKATMMASARPGMGNERLQYPRVGKIHDFLRREDILEDGEAIFDNLPVEQHPPTELNYEEFTKLVKFFISSNYESTSDEGYLTGKDLCIVYQEVGKNVGTRAKYYLVDIMDGQSFQINKVSNSTYNVTKNGDQKIAILSFYTPKELKNKLPPEVLVKLSKAKEPEIGSDVAVEEPKEIMADAEESSITKEIMTRIPIEEWSYMLKWQTGGLKPIQLSPYVPTYSKQKEAIGDLAGASAMYIINSFLNKAFDIPEESLYYRISHIGSVSLLVHKQGTTTGKPTYIAAYAGIQRMWFVSPGPISKHLESVIKETWVDKGDNYAFLTSQDALISNVNQILAPENMVLAPKEDEPKAEPEMVNPFEGDEMFQEAFTTSGHMALNFFMKKFNGIDEKNQYDIEHLGSVYILYRKYQNAYIAAYDSKKGQEHWYYVEGKLSEYVKTDLLQVWKNEGESVWPLKDENELFDTIEAIVGPQGFVFEPQDNPANEHPNIHPEEPEEIMKNPFEGDEMFKEHKNSWEDNHTYNLSSIVKSWDNKVEYSIQEVEIPGFNWACIYYLLSATEIELNKQGEPYYYVWWANYPDDDLGISTMEQAIKMQWGINVSKEEIKIHSLETIPAYVEEPEEEKPEVTDANPFEGDPMFKEATASKYVAAEADDKHPLMYDTLPLASYIKKMCKLAIPHMFAADIFFWETAPGNGLWYLEMQKTQDSKPFWWYDKKWIGVKTVQRVLRDTYGLEVPTDMINWGVWKYPNPPTEANEEEVIAKEAPMENPFEGDEMFQEAGGEWTKKKISYDRDVFEAFINKDMDVTQIYGPNFGLYHSIGMSDSHDGYHLRFLYGGHTFAFVPENKTLLYIKAGETNSGSIASAEIAAAVEIKKLAMKKGYSILNELPPNKHDEPELDIGDPFAGDEMFKEASAGHISYWTDDEPLEFILKQTSDAEHQNYMIKEIMDYGIKGYESVRQYTIQYPNVPNLIFILQAKKDVSGGLYERWRKGDDSEFTSTEVIGVLSTKWQDSLLHPEFEEPEEMENPFEGDEMFKENESLQSTYTSKDVALINSFYFGDEEYKSGDHSDNLSIAQGETFWAIVDTNTKKYLLVFKGSTSMTYINTDIPPYMVKTIEIICNKYYGSYSKENMIQYADSTQLHQLMTKWLHSYKISGEASEPDEPMPKQGGEKFDPFEGDEMFKEAKADYKGYHQATDEELLIHFINQDFDWYESEQYELDVINYGSRITHNKYPDSMNMVAMFVENDGLWYVSEFAPVALQESLEKLYNYDHVHFLDSKGQIEKDEVLIKANQNSFLSSAVKSLKPSTPEEPMENPFEGDPMFKEHFGS